jgi:Grx4 family monothiol glutaredoxin
MASIVAANHTVVDVTTLNDWKMLLAKPAELVVIFFWAEFHQPSKKGGQIDTLYTALSKKHTSVKFVKVDVEQVPDIVDMYPVTDVPTFVFLRPGPKVTVLGTLEGVHPAELASSITKHLQSSVAAASVEMEKRLKKLVSSAPVMVFMKGTPDEPKCKFSRALVTLLKEEGVSYGSFNILEDPRVRSSLKDFSNWKTYPQVYQHGKLIGGLDTIKEIKSKSGSLSSLVQSASSVAAAVANANSSASSSSSTSATENTETKEELHARLVKLTTMGQIVLFMKGTPDSPKCGFSRTMVGLLKEENLDFESFDILEDPAVRSELKIFSDWPTYPQLYVNGELQGGLDVIKEMKEDEGSIAEAIGYIPTNDRIKQLIASDEVFLFMKGDPETPRCGFSRKMVGHLKEANITFSTFDILSDKGIRAQIKIYSDWPTFPQLYVRNELIGGLDIVKEMLEEDGDLKEALGLLK